MGQFNMVGNRFGNLTVKAFAYMSRGKNQVWECICDCGKTCYVRGKDLRSGQVLSCGCPVVEVEHKVEVGQKVRFDPFIYLQGQLGDFLRGNDVTGTIVYVNYPHGWFSVEYGKQRTSFNFVDIGRTVTICG